MSLLTYPKFSAQDVSGVNLSGGKVYFYEAGTSIPKDTYSDSSFMVVNTNPVILDSRGEADIYINGSYKIVMKDSNDVEILSQDNYSSETGSQWGNSIPSTFSTTTSFTVTGDLRTEYEANRRIKLNDATTLYGTITSSTYFSPDTTVNVTLDSGSLSASLTDSKLSILTQSNDSLPREYIVYKGAAAGTADAITASLTPTLSALTDGTVCFVKAFLSNTTTTPTFNPDGLGAKTITKEGSQPLVAGDIARVDHELILRYNSANAEWELLNPSISYPKDIQSITGTVAANALTAGLNPTQLTFRDSTLADGTPTVLNVNSALSLVVPSGATLGTVSAVQSRLILLAIDNAGTVELAIVNQAGGNNLDETTLISTTAIDATADSNNVIYSTTARTNVPFRVVGYIESTQATAGTWATAPSTLQGAGGRALIPLSSEFISSEQTVTAGGLLTIAHGLGRTPSLLQARLICKTAEHGYSIGDELLMNGGAETTSGNNNYGLSIVPDATNISVRYGSDAFPITILNKGSGATQLITPAYWKLVVRAWA